MSHRQPTHNEVSRLCNSLRSETKVKKRREAVQELLRIVSDKKKRAALAREAALSGGGSDRRIGLEKMWRSALKNVLFASEELIDGKAKATKDDVTAPFRLVAACDADVPTRTPFKEPDEGAMAVMANGKGASKLGANEVDALLNYVLKAISNEEVRSVRAVPDILQFLIRLCSRMEYVAYFSQIDINHILSEVQLRIQADKDTAMVEAAIPAATIFANLIYQCTALLGMSMHIFVRPSIEMVADWCDSLSVQERGESMCAFLFSAVTNLMATHAEQAVKVLEDRGSSLLSFAKRRYKSARGIAREALNDYFSAHLLVCEVAGRLQGLLPGDLGGLGKASLDLSQIRAILMLVAQENELIGLFDEPKSKEKKMTSAVPSRIIGKKRKERSRAGGRGNPPRQGQMRARNHSGLVSWTPLSKRQRRHLELCARLIRCAQRFSIANVEVNAMKDPVYILIDQTKELRDSGERGGRHNLSDEMLPGLERCPWIEYVAAHLCSTNSLATNLSQVSAGSTSSPVGRKSLDSSFLSSNGETDPLKPSTEDQLYKSIPMLQATLKSSEESDLNAASVISYLQLISACAEAFPRGDCWSSNTKWERRKETEHKISTNLTYRNFSSTQDVASVVFLVTDILSSFGGASGDRNVQMWGIVCLLKLSESSALICHHTILDSSSSKAISFVWRHLWDVIFRTDLQYRSYTARAFPGSLGELVLMLLTEIIRTGLADISSTASPGCQRQTMRNPASFVYERQGQIFSLPVFKDVAMIHCSAPFELACMVLCHAGLSNDGHDVLSDPHDHLNEESPEESASLSSLGRRFRLLGYCLRYIESVISDEVKEGDVAPELASAGACIAALISGECALVDSSFSIVSGKTLRITEDAVELPSKHDILKPSNFPIWDELPLKMECHVEQNRQLRRILSGRGARLFFSNSFSDLVEMGTDCSALNIDYVSASTSDVLRKFVIDCMKRYLALADRNLDSIDIDMEGDDDDNAKSEECSVNGRLLAAKVYFVAVAYSVDLNNTYIISDLFDAVNPVLEDATEKLENTLLTSTERASIASKLFSIHRTLVALSSAGCGAVPRYFGESAHRLYDACKSVLQRYSKRPDQSVSSQPLPSTGTETNDFDDSEDETTIRASAPRARECDDDFLEDDEPCRKRTKTATSSCRRHRENTPDEIPPDAHGAWLCAAIMATLQPSYECCLDVTDFLVFPGDDGEDQGCIAETELVDCVVSLGLFGTSEALNRHQRLKQYFSKRKSSARSMLEDQSVLSLLCQIILQARSSADLASPFFLYGFHTCAKILQIVELEKTLDGIDEQDYGEVVEVLNPEEIGNKDRRRRARKGLRTRPYLRAGQLTAATNAFMIGGSPFHKKFDNFFAKELIIPSLSSISYEVRSAAVDAVGAALKLFPNQDVIIRSVVKSLPPLVSKRDEEVVAENVHEWIMNGPAARNDKPGVSNDELWDMEAAAWRDASAYLEFSAVECRGMIAGCTPDKASARTIVFELIETALVRPSLETICLRACEQAAVLQGFSTVGDMLLDHDCEWILQRWLHLGRRISLLPMLVLSPWMAHRLLEVHIWDRCTCDEEGSLASRHTSAYAKLDMGALREEVMAEYCVCVASSLIPTILTASPNIGCEEDAQHTRDRRWDYLTETCALLTGSESDGDIAKVLRAHLHDIYAVVLPMLQHNCCEKDSALMEKTGNSAFTLLKSLLSEDIISLEAAEDAHLIVLELLRLSSKSLSYHGGMELRKEAYYGAISYVAKMLGESSKGGIKGGLFQRAGSSTPECILHSRLWLSRCHIMVDQERSWEVMSSICSQVLSDAGDGETTVGLGFTIYTLCGVLLDRKVAHFRGRILNTLERLITTPLLEMYKKEVIPILGRIVMALLQVHDSAQQEFISHCVSGWRGMQTNVRASIGLCIGSRSNDSEGNVWGWGDTSALEANSSYDTDLKLALSSIENEERKEAAGLMVTSYNILDLILLNCASLNEALQVLCALPKPTATSNQQKALADRNEKFSLSELLKDFAAASGSGKKVESLSVASEITQFIKLWKQYPISKYEAPRHSGISHGMGIEERSVLAGLHRLGTYMNRHDESEDAHKDRFQDLIFVLFSLCDANVANEIRVEASRCLGLLGWFDQEEAHLDLKCSKAHHVLGTERAMELLSKSVQSDDVETAIIAKDTAKALLETEEGKRQFKSLDEDAQIILLPFTSGKSRAKPPKVPPNYLNRLANRIGLRYDDIRKDTNWCWRDDLWKCPEGGDISFEQWIRDIATAILHCCYGKAKNVRADEGVRVKREFFPICTAMCAQEHHFAAALFPALIFDILASDSSNNGLEQDLVRQEISIGPAFSDANDNLTRCFSIILGSNNDRTNSDALGLTIDTLDSLRYATQIRFQNARSHKKNTKPVKKSASRRRRSSGRSNELQNWRGVPFGIVLHLHGPSVVRACIQCKRFVSGLFYAELYADNWLGGSREVLERFSRDRAEVLKSNDSFPKLDISGSGICSDDSRSYGDEQFGDVLSCARIFTGQYRQCLRELNDTDALRGVSAQELVVTFDRTDNLNAVSSTLRGHSEEWRILSEIDMRLQASRQNEVPFVDREALVHQLEEMGLRHVLGSYLQGLHVTPVESHALREKWFQDSWRAFLWDDSLLQRGSVGTYMTPSQTDVPSQSFPVDIVAPKKVHDAHSVKEGFHQSLASAFGCMLRQDKNHYGQNLLQARQSLIDEMCSTIGQESLMAGVSEFACKLNVLNQLDALHDSYFGHSSLSDSIDLFQSLKRNKSSEWEEDELDFLPNVSFSSKEFALSVKEVTIRICSSKLSDPKSALANHLWFTCAVARRCGRPSIAHGALHRLSQLVKVSDFEGATEEYSTLTNSMRLKLEEAKILSCQGDPDSVRVAKLVISTLRGSLGVEDKNKVAGLYSDALLLCGDWMTRNKSESGTTVMNCFLEPGAREAQEIYQKSQTTSDGRRACQALFSLGEFVAKLFDNVETRVKSLEWKRQGMVAKGRQRELEESDELLQKAKKERDQRRCTDLNAHVYVVKKEVESDKKEREAVEQSVLTYLSMAVTSYGKALSICDPGTCGDVSKHVFRFISLWFNNCHRSGHDEDVNKIIRDIQEGIPSFLFIPLTYQIFSRVDGETGSFQDALRRIVTRMSSDHPYHCIGQLIALANGDKVGTGVSGRQANMYLGNVGSSKIEASKEILQEIAKDSKKKNGRSYVASLIDSYTAIYESYIQLAMCSTKKFVNEKKTKGINLSEGCSNLKNWNENDFDCLPCVLTKPPLLIPSGDYGKGSRDPVGSERVLGFEPTFSITDSGLHRPKIIHCNGTKGKYRQLVKGEDDLRQDAIMQQVFSTVNNLLKTCASMPKDDGTRRAGCQGSDHSGTRQRKLKLITYQTIPLSPTSGVLEWVESTLPFRDFLSDSGDKIGAHSRYFPGEWSSGYCWAQLDKAKQHRKREIYDEICQNFSPVFRFFFLERFSHSLQAWYAARTLYTRSCAVNSIVGHVLGIGDRHTQNILIHQETGEVVHIDFGIVFEQGKVLPTPETIPFRLSRDIVDGMGPFGTEGVFSIAAEATARVLRDNADSLLTILSAVVSDPLFKWALNPIKARQRQQRKDSEDQHGIFNVGSFGQEDNFPEAADRAIAKISEKLQGYEEGTSGESQSVEGQVQLLINSARDPDNLCVLFPGWCPWL